VAAIVAGLVVAGAGTAAASHRPVLSITGEPTAEETATISELWRAFTDRFSPQWACMGPVEVRVVDRAEDWYSGRNFGSIAAFYRVPPDAIVFVEHGKVNGDNLLHEFGHHLDLSCGVGDSSHGRAFRAAQGLAPGTPWLRGPTWATVPAEGFAESVIATFGESPAIWISPEGLDTVWELARVPVWLEQAPPLPLGHPGIAELARVVNTDTGMLAAL
jgi:hypothetical protein